MERPDGSTLRWALEVIDEVAATLQLAAASGPLFSVNIEFGTTSTTTTVAEPAVRDRRNLLDLLRHLDMPSSDIRLPRLYEIVRRVGVTPDWQAGLRDAEADYARAQAVSTFRVEDPDVPRASRDDEPMWVTPREAFRLWLYGGVIHREWAKEQRWARFSPVHQGITRTMAHEYAEMLLRQAEFMSGLLRRGVVIPDE
jgi:hypothetical protein